MYFYKNIVLHWILPQHLVPFKIKFLNTTVVSQMYVQPILEEFRKVKAKICNVSTRTESTEQTVGDYAVPSYNMSECYNLLSAKTLVALLFSYVQIQWAPSMGWTLLQCYLAVTW